MAAETVQAQWIEGNVFLLRDRSDFPLVMTQPNGVNGADLLPLSLIGCAAWDVMSILQKQRQLVHSLRVTAESEREDEPPWRFKRIRIRYHIHGTNLNAAHVQRAIELSEEKYCSIYATLRQAIELTSELDLTNEANEQEGPHDLLDRRVG
jgi:putative redox protein